MITAHDLATGEDHQGQTVESIARRLHGRTVEIRAEHDAAYLPVGTTYTVVKRSRYGDATWDVLGRLRVDGDPAMHYSPLVGLGEIWADAAQAAESARLVLRSNVLEAVEQGTTVAEAARLSGVSRETIHSWLRGG